MLYGVVQSVLLYVAPVWKRAIEVDKYRKMVNALQRKMLLRYITAYRTVSAEAACVLAGIPPMDLLVRERACLDEILEVRGIHKGVERHRTIREWQDRWENNNRNAQWIKRLIPDVETWSACKRSQLNYYVTQFFTGHGSFRNFTSWIGKNADDVGIYCGMVDDAEHTLFVCDGGLGKELPTNWLRESQPPPTQL
nr:uncharacterized protein LOC111508906 [Leptinotarsa decemlineata]